MNQENDDVKMVRYAMIALVCIFVAGALANVADTALKRQPGCGATIYKAEDP